MKRLVLFLVCMLFTSLCSAKELTNSNGSVSFTAPENWVVVEAQDTETHYAVLHVGDKEKSTVTFDQIKLKEKFSDFSVLPADTRDNIMKSLKEAFDSSDQVKIESVNISMDDKNYYAEIRGTEKGVPMKSFSIITVRNYIYCWITATALPDHYDEIVKVAKSLKINGVPFDEWPGQ